MTPSTHLFPCLPQRRPSIRAATVALALALLTTVAPLPAQPEPPPKSTAAPEDVESVDSILETVYEILSGPGDQPRDWERFRSLFLPGARLIPTWGDPDNGYRHGVRTLDEYIDRVSPIFERDGFYENEIHRVEERYGPTVHALSTYESRHKPDAAPFARGVNSIQLFWDGSRWWIVTIYWYGETPGHPIPENLLPN